MSQFEIVEARYGQLGPLAQRAFNNDLLENFYVLARMAALGPVAVGLSSLIMGDLVAVRSAVSQKLAIIESHFTWLKKSSQSEMLLARAVSQWTDIGVRQSHILAQVVDGNDRLARGDWSGESRGGYFRDVTGVENKETAFAESLARIVDGCERSRRLTEQLMSAFNLSLGSTLGQSRPAEQGPSGGSMKARNWRLRHVDTQLGVLQSQLAGLRSKRDWAHLERDIASIFRAHSEVLAALRNVTGGGPTQVYAV